MSSRPFTRRLERVDLVPGSDVFLIQPASMQLGPFASALGIAICLASGVVRADPSPGEIQAARDLFTKAEQDEDAGSWAAALEKLHRAASVKTTPGIRYHIGLCEEKLGQIAAALNDYSGAEALAREQHNREVLDIVAEPIRALKARVPTLLVDAPTGVDGLTIDLDGKAFPAGLWGIATPMEPGSHQIEARATGKTPFSASVVLKEKDAAKLPIRLMDAPKTETTSAIKTPPAVTPEVHATNPADAPPANVEDDQPRSRAPAIVTTVSALVIGGFGVAAYFVADGQQTDAKAYCLTQAVPSCAANQSQIRAWDAVALSSWITAGALVVVSIVLWAMPSHKSATTQARRDGMWLTGSF